MKLKADLIVAPFDPPVPSFSLYVPDECHASRTRIGPYEPEVDSQTHVDAHALSRNSGNHSGLESKVQAYRHHSLHHPAVLQCPPLQLHSRA